MLLEKCLTKIVQPRWGMLLGIFWDAVSSRVWALGLHEMKMLVKSGCFRVIESISTIKE